MFVPLFFQRTMSLVSHDVPTLCHQHGCHRGPGVTVSAALNPPVQHFGHRHLFIYFFILVTIFGGEGELTLTLAASLVSIYKTMVNYNDANANSC